ncbi:peptide/nickel transport system ATP-binding protein [Quadrisphaera granulorum]|uniref:Peptide/nickel transport system ATP-binding protein n=1 Tax=Quadrisphaera granulorum TaxID=317664 RepID=A0A315ZWE5_9ACTN|nr:ABC transporter ATP-binding protein [Quadrisphaera granulorum]PWJ49573.1 peptide/nickel transport system ATP-binding protein [Quadrisphaera granulorum]SZE98152.1 peptide/nickel transport system ATP-binding protein [Quadrisphaera granulorum]
MSTSVSAPSDRSARSDRSALSAEGLRVAYGDVEVVRGVDLVVRPGEKVGVVGESGCGKSTVALALMGLLASGGAVTGGVVSVAGGRVDYRDEKALDRMRGSQLSLVFQDPLTSLDPVKTIGSQIAEALRRHNPRMSRAAVRARCAELLTAVGVPEPERRLRQYPHEFSGGMRQRALIAIAVANDPAVLIADEPTTALDVTTQAQVVELLDSLVDRLGVAVVLVTHDIGLVSEFCDRVMVMYAGRVVEEVPSAALFDGAAHPYTRALLGSLPVPGRPRSDDLTWIPGAPPPLAALPAGCSFAPRCTWAQPECSAGQPPRVVVPSPGTTTGEVHVAECRRALEVVASSRSDESTEGEPRG